MSKYPTPITNYITWGPLPMEKLLKVAYPSLEVIATEPVRFTLQTSSILKYSRVPAIDLREILSQLGLEASF